MVINRRWLALVVLGTGCEFIEITEPGGEPIIVVQGVLNTAASRQYVLIENSFTRGSPGGDQYYAGRFPDGPTRNPLTGANATISIANAAPSCATPEVMLRELRPDELLFPFPNDTSATGIYVTDSMCALRAGYQVTLSVRARDGRTATATTIVPGATSTSIALTKGQPIAADTFVLDRSRDSVWVDIEAVAGRGMQLEVVDAAPRTLNQGITAISDTMRAVVAGNAVLPFDGRDGARLFEAGGFFYFVAMVTDTNYFDYARSGSDEFTGRGFINHVNGGIGVFGSVHPTRKVLRVVDRQTDPREGIYHITGTLPGGPVDVLLNVYFRGSPRPDSEQDFRAFFEGTWNGAALTTSVSGSIGPRFHVTDTQTSLNWYLPDPDGFEFPLGANPGGPGETADLLVRLSDRTVDTLSIQKR